ncbi:unnamed protein product [Anisakis simplex]|uniref:FAS1 domain-containing protein n=1 Tax=Anisakis simplex TaxID=6269 RepID=A0A0M3JFH4_ANISI|nr:unnamed protein product [Anisakis simplex]
MVTAVKELTIAASAAAPNNASVVAVYDSDNFASKFRAKMPGLVLVNDVNKSFGNILKDILDASSE